MHRDVSDKNIMIYEDPGKPGEPAVGMLMDWDLSKFMTQLNEEPVQVNRSVRAQ